MKEYIQDGKGIAFLPINNDKLVPIEDVQIEKLTVHFSQIKTLQNTSLMNYLINKNPSFTNLKEGFSYFIQSIFHTFCSTSALFSFLFRFIFFKPLTVPTNPFEKTSNTIMYNKPRIIVHRSKIGYSVASSDK